MGRGKKNREQIPQSSILFRKIILKPKKMVIVASHCVGIHDFAHIFGPLPVQPSIEPRNFYDSKDLVSPEGIEPEEVPALEVYEGIEDFEVGKGAFGKIHQVRKRGSSHEIYAIKVMRKDKIVDKGHEEYIRSEREILMNDDHPFIVRLRYSFETKYRLYLVLDFVNGGHLLFQLHQHGLFREDLARVYAAEIVSAVGYLHANGIMHRDLKPENIQLDAHGHIMLTDFGFAKIFDDKTRCNSMCGTMEYMAPEVVIGKGHDKAADWWSVGILLYEMLPFTGGNRYKVQQKITKDKVKLPSFLSSEAHYLLKGQLLQKDPKHPARMWSKRGGRDQKTINGSRQ